MSDIGAHLPYLLEEALKAQAIIEFGVRAGGSTGVFLLSRRELGGGLLYSADIDPHCEDVVRTAYGEMANDWRFFGMSSQDLRLINAVAETQPVDLVFIDSSHEAAQTTNELNIYAPMLKSGGKFILHDTEEANRYWNEGVRIPMLKFLQTHPFFTIEREVTFSHGMTTLRKQ